MSLQGSYQAQQDLQRYDDVDKKSRRFFWRCVLYRDCASIRFTAELG